MLEGLIHDAKSAAGSVVSKYAARASVMLPFAIALGFATAGTALLLVEQFGARTAFFILAAGFTAIGLIAAIVVTGQERREVVAEDKTAKEAKVESAESTTASVVAAAEQMPLALIGTLLNSEAGAATAQRLGRVLGRNVPLLLMCAAVTLLLWPKGAPGAPLGPKASSGTVPQPAQNGHDPQRDLRQVT